MVENQDLRELIMQVSDMRAKDQEKFEVHIKLMNSVVDSIREFSGSIKSKWGDISAELDRLKATITSSLESLLASINPEGINETTKNLERIMDSMQKSTQSMNLDNIMQQIRYMTGNVSAQLLAELDAKEKGEPQQPGSSAPAAQPAPETAPTPGGEETYGHVPDEYKKKQEEKKKGQDKMLKPSDLFG